MRGRNHYTKLGYERVMLGLRELLVGSLLPFTGLDGRVECTTNGVTVAVTVAVHRTGRAVQV